MQSLTKEWQRVCLAFGFFTRISVPSLDSFKEEDLAGAAKYFPLVGIVVGMVGAGMYLVATRLFPSSIAILLSMAATLYLTGAFHEDGLADSADGFGGGWGREQILTIMQDSRLGTYGAVVLCLVLFGKYQVLNALPDYFLAFILVVGHALSRLAAVYVMASLPYAKPDGKAKPLATRVGWPDLCVATVLACLPIPLFYWHFSPFVFEAKDWLVLGGHCVSPMILVWIWWRNKIQHWLGGYTGDCLGAMQQLTELALYIGLLAWCQQL